MSESTSLDGPLNGTGDVMMTEFPHDNNSDIVEEVIVLDTESPEDAEKKDTVESVGFFQLFRYADNLDYFLLFLGTIGAMGCGGMLAAFSLVFGQLLDDFNDPTVVMMDKIREGCLIFVYFGIGCLFGGIFTISCFMYTSERQSKKVRELFLDSLLRQEVSYHDVQKNTDLATSLTADTRKFQEGISDKLAMVIQNSFGFIAALVISFVKGWELTLVLLAFAPLLMIVSSIMGHFMANSTSMEQKDYGEAGTIATETFNNIRTVVSNQMEHSVVAKYYKTLEKAYVKAKKKGIIQGVSMGFFMIIIFSLYYGFGLWYGSKLIYEPSKSRWPGLGSYTGGTVITVFYALISGVMMLGQSAPHFAAVASAMGVAAPIFKVIERKSLIDPFDDSGLNVSPNNTTGRVRFVGVHFCYPSRPDAKILKNLNLEIDIGFNALVGHSGCGKSTVIQLLERYYDPDEGSVEMEVCLKSIDAGSDAGVNTVVIDGVSYFSVDLVDGVPPEGTVMKYVNLKDICVSSLRNTIGLVAQEPVLFSGTVRENIKYGNPVASDADVIESAKQANAHDFIMKLQSGYDTQVGERGRLVSGGQKQRIAIARMLLLPKSIYLSDEATAALDNKSEKVVQKALDRIIIGDENDDSKKNKKMSIVIAHRLSTIRNANRIIVFNNGCVAEDGTHDYLMTLPEGIYASLVTTQTQIDKEHEGFGDNVEDVEETPGSIHDNQAGDSDSEDEGESDYDPDDVIADADGEEADYEVEASKVRDVSRIYSKSHLHQSTNTDDKKPKKKDDDDIEDIFNLEEHTVDYNRSVFYYLIELIKKRPFLFIIGTLCAAAEGCSLPIYSMLMSKMSYAFYEPAPIMMSITEDYAVWFTLLGIACFIVTTLKFSLLSLVAEYLMKIVREKTFTSIVSQEVGFHDTVKNSAGILVTRLANDATFIRTMLNDRYGTFVSVFANLILSIILCFTSKGSWKMSLLMYFVILPILSFAGIIQFKIISGFSSKSRKSIEKAGAIAVESMASQRTVASFNGEKALNKNFSNTLDAGLKAGQSSAIYAGIGFGIAQLGIYCGYAISFYFGGLMVDKGEMSFENMLKVFLIVEMVSMQIGQLFQSASDFDKSNVAIRSVYNIINRKSLRSVFDESGSKPVIFSSPSDKGIAFENVNFTYPIRHPLSTPTLTNVSFTCEKGQSTALVGESGCGKSTVFALLQRYYDPIQKGAFFGFSEGCDRANVKLYADEITTSLNTTYENNNLVPYDPVLSGKITINGHNINDINLRHYRKHFGVVGQEPVLFAGTIADNIRAGDDSITDEMIEKAAKLANVHDLIMTKFPDKYDTQITGSSSLSGGQKQRIAIARCMVRHSSLRLEEGVSDNGAGGDLGDGHFIQLWDEATSALDNISEKLVQQSLENSLHNTTTIIIAHRLSTIRNCDKIVVLGNGTVLEEGTHDSLMAKNGHYARLVGTQVDGVIGEEKKVDEKI